MDKIRVHDIRKAGACSEGVHIFKQYFPRGANFTFEDAHKAIVECPPSFIHWWIEKFIGDKAAESFYKILNKSIDRAYSVSDWETEDKRMARWLLRTAQKHLEGR